MPSYLTIRRPSPTTVSFMVSNAPLRSTLSAKVIFYAGTFLRIVVGFCVLLIDAAKVRNNLFLHNGLVSWEDFWTTATGHGACRVADWLDWRVVVIGSGILFYLIFRKGYTGS